VSFLPEDIARAVRLESSCARLCRAYIDKDSGALAKFVVHLDSDGVKLLTDTTATAVLEASVVVLLVAVVVGALLPFLTENGDDLCCKVALMMQMFSIQKRCKMFSNFW